MKSDFTNGKARNENATEETNRRRGIDANNGNDHDDHEGKTVAMNVSFDRILGAVCAGLLLVASIAVCRIDVGKPPTRPLESGLAEAVESAPISAIITTPPPADAPRVSRRASRSAETAADPLAGAAWPNYPEVEWTPFDAEHRPRGDDDISGMVVDVSGVPISSARVAVQFPDHAGNWPQRSEISQKTCAVAVNVAADGAFRITQLPQTPFRLIAEAPFHAPAVRNIALPTAELTIQLDRFGIIVADVRDDAGHPVTDFSVLIVPADTAAAMVANPAEADFVETARYASVTDPMPSLQRLVFRRTTGRFAAYTGIGHFRTIVFSRDSTTRPTVQIFTPANTVVPTSFTLSAATTIAGRVTDSAGHHGIFGAMVVAVDAQTEQFLARATSDADGRYRLELPKNAGTGTVTVRIETTAGRITDHTVTPTPGRVATVNAITTGAAVAGTVADESATALPGVTVHLTRPDAFVAARTAVTGADGRFSIDGVSPGRYAIVVPPSDGFLLARHEIDVPDRSADDGDFDDGDGDGDGDGDFGVGNGNGEASVEIVITRIRGAHCVFAVSVDGSADGVLPADARLMLRDVTAPPLPLGWPKSAAHALSGTFSATPNADGRTIEMIGVPAGEYSAWLDHAAFEPLAVPIRVEHGGGVQSFALAVAAGFVVVGTIRDASGQPISGAMVEVAPSDDPRTAQTQRRAQTGPDGRFRLGGLRAVRYRIDAWKRDFRPHTDTFVPVAGETVWNARLDAGAALVGTVRDASGEPISQGIVELLAPPRGPYELQPRTLIQNGEFRMGGLVPGIYEMRVTSAGFLPRTLSVEIFPAQTPIAVTLDHGSGLVLVLRDGAGTPISATATIQKIATAAGPAGASNAPLTVAVPATGSTRVSGLVAGDYTVAFFADGFAPTTIAARIEGETTVTATLEPGFAITGHIRTAQGQPAAVLVALVENRWETGCAPMPAFPTPMPVDSRTGGFAFTGLDAGMYRVLVLDPTTQQLLVAEAITLDLAAPAPAPMALSITNAPTTAHRLTGRVVGETGGGMAGLMVALQSADNPFFNRLSATAADGAFQFVNVPPGMYELIATTTAGRTMVPIRTDITVPTADVVGVEFMAADEIAGVRIKAVRAGSGVADALRRNDLIVAVDQMPTRTAFELASALAAKAGQTVTVQVRRAGLPAQSVPVTAASGTVADWPFAVASTPSE